MLNFKKKKYVSFDNLKSFNGLLQSSLKEKIDGYKSEIDVKVDERFKVLSGQQQKDSEVIDAREGQVSLFENLKTYVKKEEHENLDNKISNQIEEIKTDTLTMSNKVEVNTEYINTNKSAIQRVIDFVDNFRFECSFGNSSFVKMPDVLGGLIIQWGSFNPNISEIGGESMFPFYPRAFATNHHTIVGTINAFNINTNVREVVGYIRKAEKEKFRYRLATSNSNLTSDIYQIDINWIAIGK